MPVFTLSAKFEEYASENLALSQDFLDLKPSLYELVLFSKISANWFSFFLFPVYVSVKSKGEIAEEK